MRRSWLVAGAFVSLIVIGGCLGILGEESTPTAPPSPSPSVPSPTESPASTAVPTASPTREVLSLPATVSRPTIASPEEYANTHRAKLENTSYTARYRYVRREDGTVTTRNVGVVRYDGTDTFYANSTTLFPRSGILRRVETWSNGTVAHRAVTDTNGTVVTEIQPDESVLTFADRVAAYLEAFEVNKTGYAQLGDEQVVRLSDSGFDRRSGGETIEWIAFRFGLGEIEAARFSAVVGNETLHQYRVEFIDRRRFTTITVTETLLVTKLGSTRVRRPGWAVGTNETESP